MLSAEGGDDRRELVDVDRCRLIDAHLVDADVEIAQRVERADSGSDLLGDVCGTTDSGNRVQ